MSYFLVAPLTPGDLHIKYIVNKANAQSLSKSRVRKVLWTRYTVLYASSILQISLEQNLQWMFLERKNWLCERIETWMHNKSGVMGMTIRK